MLNMYQFHYQSFQRSNIGSLILPYRPSNSTFYKINYSSLLFSFCCRWTWSDLPRVSSGDSVLCRVIYICIGRETHYLNMHTLVQHTLIFLARFPNALWNFCLAQWATHLCRNVSFNSHTLANSPNLFLLLIFKLFPLCLGNKFCITSPWNILGLFWDQSTSENVPWVHEKNMYSVTV